MLSVNRLINVTVNLGATPVPGRTFNTLMIAGDSAVISGAQRFRSYTTLEGVANDFGLKWVNRKKSLYLKPAAKRTK